MIDHYFSGYFSWFVDDLILDDVIRFLHIVAILNNCFFSNPPKTKRYSYLNTYIELYLFISYIYISFLQIGYLPSGNLTYIAIEHDHRNGWFTHGRFTQL